MFSKLSNLIPRGIGLRFSLWFAILFTCCSVLCLVLAYTFAAKSLREGDQKMIVAKQVELSKLIHGDDVSELSKRIKEQANGDESEFFVRVTDAHGKQLYIDEAFDDLDEFDKIPSPGHAGISLGDGLWNEILSKEFDEYLELYSAKLPNGGWLEVGHSSEDREDILTSFRDQLPWIALSLLIGGLCCGFFFTNRALSPIRELIKTVKSIKEGDISARVKGGSTDDELDTLKRLFNEMLDQVQALIEGMNRTTDGLAHDIKTPITRLRTIAELALAKDPKDEDLREALITTIENSDQIVSLVDALMDVSEAEAGATKLKLAPVDVTEMIDSVVDLYQFTAEDKNLSLNFEKTNEKFIIKGDLIQLRRAVANLVDNAIKYTPGGGEVLIRVKKELGKILVSVTDTGRGISATELPHIWSRLFRGDLSRSEKGMGLGLSLVKAIVEVHGGKILVESRLGKGSTFTLVLN